MRRDASVALRQRNARSPFGAPPWRFPAVTPPSLELRRASPLNPWRRRTFLPRHCRRIRRSRLPRRAVSRRRTPLPAPPSGSSRRRPSMSEDTNLYTMDAYCSQAQIVVIYPAISPPLARLRPSGTISPSRRSSACFSCLRSTRGIRCCNKRSPSASGSWRRSVCGCSRTGGCGGCGSELPACYRNRRWGFASLNPSYAPRPFNQSLPSSS